MERLVYDGTTYLHFPWIDSIVFSLIFILIGIYLRYRKVYHLACLRHAMDKRAEFRCKFIGVLAPIFLFIALLIFGTKLYRDTKVFFSLTSATEEKTYHTITGRINNFVPMPYTGHMEESFDVGDVSFHYSDYVINNYFFNQTKSHGGPIRENGQKVKIDYMSFDYTGCLPLVEYFGLQCPQLTDNKIIKLWTYE